MFLSDLQQRMQEVIFFANRALMTLFQVTVNPNRRFVLSDWIERGDENDEDDLPTKKMKGH